MAGSLPRGWAWATTVALFLLMTMGNIVSATARPARAVVSRLSISLPSTAFPNQSPR